MADILADMQKEFGTTEVSLPSGVELRQAIFNGFPDAANPTHPDTLEGIGKPDDAGNDISSVASERSDSPQPASGCEGVEISLFPPSLHTDTRAASVHYGPFHDPLVSATFAECQSCGSRAHTSDECSSHNKEQASSSRKDRPRILRAALDGYACQRCGSRIHRAADCPTYPNVQVSTVPTAASDQRITSDSYLEKDTPVYRSFSRDSATTDGKEQRPKDVVWFCSECGDGPSLHWRVQCRSASI
jgi:DNA-directed RNA polymerase subunit RPC12/RpoP